MKSAYFWRDYVENSIFEGQLLSHLGFDSGRNNFPQITTNNLALHEPAGPYLLYIRIHEAPNMAQINEICLFSA